jgi:hypothetical protein
MDEDGDNNQFLAEKMKRQSLLDKSKWSLNKLTNSFKKVKPTKSDDIVVNKTEDEQTKKQETSKRIVKTLKATIDNKSIIYLLWISIVSSAYIFNLLSISLRFAFEYDLFEMDVQQQQNSTTKNLKNETNSETIVNDPYSTIRMWWSLIEYVCDLLYLVDIFLVQTRIKFLREGLWVNDLNETIKNYLKSWKFSIDILSVMPYDVLFRFYLSGELFIGIYSLIRVNRLLKIHSLWEFFDRWDRHLTKYAFVVRLIRLLVYLQIVIHFYACGYYKLSKWESQTKKIRNDWIYDEDKGDINRYIHSFLFGLKLASTIGNNPDPETKEELLFTAILSLVALFILSVIVGQIRNIIGSLSIKQDAFLIILDATIKYTRNLNLPIEISNQVKQWFEYYSKQQNESKFFVLLFSFNFDYFKLFNINFSWI